MGGRNPFAPLGNHGKPLFVGTYKGNNMPGLLRWCEMDLVHPQYEQPKSNREGSNPESLRLDGGGVVGSHGSIQPESFGPEFLE